MTHTTDFKRNEAVGLDLGWVNQIKVNQYPATIFTYNNLLP